MRGESSGIFPDYQSNEEIALNQDASFWRVLPAWAHVASEALKQTPASFAARVADFVFPESASQPWKLVPVSLDWPC